MAFWKILTDATVTKLVEALTPWFTGKPQDSLVQFADEVADVAYQRAYDDIEILYDFRNDIQSTAGAGMVGTSSGLSVQAELDANDTAIAGKEPAIAAGTISQYWRGDKTWRTLDKAAVGLGNVDNTSDANKPISTATQTALNGKENSITAGTTSQYWRGDKTWQTLNSTAVPEGTNLYYTNARAIAAPLTGYAVGANSALAATDTILAAMGKVQGQINARAPIASPTFTGNVGVGSANDGNYGQFRNLGTGYRANVIQSSDASGVAVVLAANGANEARLNVVTNHGLKVYTNNTERGQIINSGEFRWASEVQSTSTNSYRHVQGNFGAFWRNDGASYYLLFTASGDQYGSFNSLRPWYVNLTTGYHTFGTGVNFQGNVDVSSENGLKVRSSGLGNGLDIGASPTLGGGTDPDVYLYNRLNGAIWWGTNNTLRGKFHADGRIGWNHQILATGDTFGIGFNPYNANVGRAAFVAAGAYGGGMILQDSGYWAGSFITSDNSGTYHIGVGGSSGLTSRVRVSNADYNQFLVEGVVKSRSNQAGLHFQERDSANEFAWYANGGTAKLWHNVTGERFRISQWADVSFDGNGLYLNAGWLRTYSTTGWYNETYGGGLYMTDTSYIRTYNGKGMVASSFQVSSDAKLKENVRPLEVRGRINPVSFTWKKDGKEDFGFIAQEVQEVYPEAVGRVGVEGQEDSHLVVDYARLVAPLTKMVYDLQDEVARLKEEIDALRIR